MEKVLRVASAKTNQKRMHVVIVDTTMTTPPTGGAQTFLIDLAESLVQRGMRISIVTQPGPEMTIVSALSRVGAEIELQLWSSSDLPEEKAVRLASWVNKLEGKVSFVVSISPDVGWLTLPLLNSNIATLSIAHNDVGAFYAPVEHYAPLIDCAIGVSLETTRRLRDETGMPLERVRYIPYGVHVASQADAERRIQVQRAERAPLRIVYVGRLVQEQKRVMDFVPLVRELKRRDVSFMLDLIGDGSDRSRLEQELKENGLAHNVKVWGWLTPSDVAARLADSDAFVLLSDYEGLPVALLEAMASTLVPVVTRINSGNTQLIREGENGLMFEVADAISCAKHLAQLSTDQELLRSLRWAAWKTAREYSVERMVENYERCFQEVTAPDFMNADRKTAPRPYPLLPACRSRYPFWLRKVKSRLATLRSTPMPSVGQQSR